MASSFLPTRAPSHRNVRNRLLAGLAPAVYDLLRSRLEPVPLALRQVLIQAHEPIAHAYFVEEGTASLLADLNERIEVGMIGPEGMVGVPVVLDADRGPFTALVQGQGSALRITADDLHGILDDSGALRTRLTRYAQTIMTQVSTSAYANASLNIEGRLARWILMSQDRLRCDELPMTHEFLSLMLGVRRPGVTTATHLLEGAGMIQARRGRITVLDRDKLRELAWDTYGPAEAEYERLLAQV